MEYDMKEDFGFYVSHQEEIAAKHNGFYVILHNKQLDERQFEDVDEAISYGNKKYGVGNFFVHKSGYGEENYTIRII